MKKIHFISLSMILSLFLGGVGPCASAVLAAAPSATAESSFLVMGEKYPLTAVRVHEEKLTPHVRYLIDLHYPQIVGIDLPSTAQHFNQSIQAIFKNQVSQFKKEVAHLPAEVTSAHTAPTSVDNYFKLSYYMNSFVSQSQKTEVLSIRLQIDSNMMGMAHPAHRTQVFNYDLGHDRVLQLSDLFKPGSDYLAVIAAKCIKKLQEKHLPEAMVKAGAAPKLENYKNWNMTFNGLLIIFDEAQVAPRYFGQQTVLIPLSALASIMNHQAACTFQVVRCEST